MLHILHNFVYLLLILVFILPVATANVERAFFLHEFSQLRNKMDGSLLDDCLYIAGTFVPCKNVGHKHSFL